MHAGASIEYTITWLEMDARPGGPRPPAPMDKPHALIHAEQPPVWYLLALYDAVGAGYEWTDLHARSHTELAGFIQHPRVWLYTLLRAGWPAGFFVLDNRQDGLCDLAYFGLVPQAIGLGLGPYLLGTAVHMGWDLPGVEKLSVNTCSLDHPRALPMYQKMGYSPVRQEKHSRILTRDRPAQAATPDDD